MGTKNKIRIIFFFKILTNQGFLLRLQIKGVADLPVVFLRYQFLGLVKPHCRNPAHIRKLHTQHIQLFLIILCQKRHGIL